MEGKLAGRTALVTGGSRGIGKAIAEGFAKEGAQLVINGRDMQALEASAEYIRETYGVAVLPLAADVTDEYQVKMMVAEAETFGPIDVLVNNAGGPPPGDFRDWTRDDWIKAIDANMLTAIELIKGVIDPMIENKFGRIVNITSGSVKSPIPTLGLSNGARAGLTGFVGGLARQVARHNVTINGLLPGPFDTDRIAANINFLASQSDQTPEAVRAGMEERNTSGRIGSVE